MEFNCTRFNQEKIANINSREYNSTYGMAGILLFGSANNCPTMNGWCKEVQCVKTIVIIVTFERVWSVQQIIRDGKPRT